jgi:hypothetical protein
MEDTEGQKELTTELAEMQTATKNVIRIIILRYLSMNPVRNIVLLWIQWNLQIHELLNAQRYFACVIVGTHEYVA